MDQRHAIRYDSELLPKKMTTTTLALAEDISVESQVVNYCTLGIKVVIPPSAAPAGPPKKNDLVRVLLPVAADERAWFTGRCVHAMTKSDGSVDMGIYFHRPDEQDHLHTLLITALNKPQQAPAFISHEWEELVSKLCDFDDPEMKEIGHREMDVIKARQRGKCFRPGCGASSDCFLAIR